MEGCGDVGQKDVGTGDMEIRKWGQRDMGTHENGDMGT